MPLIDTRCSALLMALSMLGSGAWAQSPPSAAPATVASSPQTENQARSFTLSNGMTLIVRPDRRAPTAVQMLWVRVGSMDEVDGSSGLAHALEHMMFKGTPDVPPGEFSRRVAAFGGIDNAFTMRDATAYHMQVPSRRLEMAMQLEADRFARNQWPDDEFKREIEVIKEERRQRTEESPRARMFEALNAMIFQASPYRRPNVGWMSDLDAMTPDDARAFYQRWYVPANSALVIAGDVDVEQTRALAEKHFGSIPARAVPARKPREEPAQVGPRRLEYRAVADQALVALAYKVPQWRGADEDNDTDRDALALAVLSAVLDGYDGARLDRALVQGTAGGKRLADSASSGYGLMGRGPQLFMLSGVPAAGETTDAVAAALKAEVARIAREGIQEAELRRVKTQWTAGEIYKLDSVANQARELGGYWIQGLGLDTGDRLIARLRAVTAEQVQSVAQRYFSDEQLTTGVLVPDPSRRETAPAQGAGPRPALTRH
ncbi:pitrilysin family protein [Hydrogenophaga sp.]|uniref:M16 family metallopeptidase n=1 Tax=Hydrogenophaga sp. TaxID=1904254 RepID=UPI002717C0C1|nr:pitrilysin family protein [Hydrogenophaga sp.]MDO9437295.1 pitrilysin family protein [Hydrogenophaga sp.]